MRLIGLLVTLAALGYATHVYLDGGNASKGGQTKPAEYIDQAKQSAEAIDDVMKKQHEQLERQLQGNQ